MRHVVPESLMYDITVGSVLNPFPRMCCNLSPIVNVRMLRPNIYAMQLSCKMASLLFWDVTQRRLVVSYGRFGTTIYNF
jgi:hypothetical protein